MPDFKPIRKAMVVIAVSNYDPPYEALPGTLTSARRIADWAKTPGEGRNYKVVEITDASVGSQPGVPVTVERLRKEITSLLDTTIVDRLVVYFAGHGAVRSTAEEFWLLTHAGQDSGECVGVMQLMNGLKNYGIGAHNPELKKGQLVIIADACRNVHRDGLAFVPNPVMTRKANAVGLQTDLFRATTLGAYAFQVKAVDGAEPYCLFSAVLCDALEGKVTEVIDDQYHPFKPVISNDALADYLDTEVPRRAAELKETMEPDNQAGIRLSHNYYDILRSGRPPDEQQREPSAALPGTLASEVLKQLGMDGVDANWSSVSFSPPSDAAVKQAFEEAFRNIPTTSLPGKIELPGGVLLPSRGGSGLVAVPDDFDWQKALAEVLRSGSPLQRVGEARQQPAGVDRADLLKPQPRAGARVARMQFEPEPDAAAGFRRSLKRADLLAGLLTDEDELPEPPRVFFDGNGPVAVPKAGAASFSRARFGWAYSPPPGFLDHSIFVRQQHGWTLAPRLQRTTSVLLEELPGDVMLRTNNVHDWDLSLSFGALLTLGTTTRVSDAKRLADQIRWIKREVPNSGIRAGYLYRFAGDDDNIVRTANYMADYGLPLDLAALAAASMRWLRRKGRWHVVADLPKVEADEDVSRPRYAGVAFPARKSVPVWGLFPIHRQGWQFLADARDLNVPKVLRDAAGGLVDAPAVVLRQSALEKLANHFGYVIVEPPET